MFICLNLGLFWVIYLRRVRSLGHRPLIVKRVVICHQVGGNSAQYLCCKVFHDWSIINIQSVNLWQPHCDLRVFRTRAYLKAIM